MNIILVSSNNISPEMVKKKAMRILHSWKFYTLYNDHTLYFHSKTHSKQKKIGYTDLIITHRNTVISSPGVFFLIFYFHTFVHIFSFK